MNDAENIGRAIVVDDEEPLRDAVTQGLQLAGFEVTAFARAERVVERIDRAFSGVVISDIRMPRMDGLQLLEAARKVDSELPVILMTGHGDVPLAVSAMRQGAYDFIEKPFATARLVESATRACELRRLTLENRALRSQLEQRDTLESVLVGRSAPIVALRERLRSIAATDIDVLLTGDTGVGKGVAARAIHDLSERAGKPFVAVNMAALPAAAIESELFGHEQGAFVGAHRARVGKFEHARGGTFFLDEIGAAPLDLQAKLLRVIEDRSITRLGSNDPIDLDVRFVASSKEDLEALVAAGAFRDDLYYRLNVAALKIPPLADRMEDAPRLFQHLVVEASMRYRRAAPDVPGDILSALSAREWPGNVRELRNAADRFVLGLGVDDDAPADIDASLAEQIERYEKNLIATALAANEGSLKATYESLRLSRKSLYEKMQKHGLRREDYAE